MRGIGRFLIALALLASGGPASAQPGPEGLYVDEMMETASALELMPGGRFRWAFTQGALDMTAEGRWRVEGGAVILDTEPVVPPPDLALLGSGREGPHPELVVRISGPEDRIPDYLEVEGEYESGAPERAGHTFGEDAWRFPAVGGRPERIVAVRISFPALNYRSARFEVPAGANLVRFRFSPNGLGRGDFRGARASLSGETLILDLLGQPLRYRRLSAEERAAQEGMIEDIATDAGADMGAPAIALSGEDAANDRICVNEGLSLPRAQAIAACTALLEGGRLPPEGVALVRFNRGNLLVDDGQHALALADFNESLRLNPDYGLAYWGRAGAHAGLGDRVREIADYREAARREPADTTVLSSLCWSLAVAGEALDEARRACDASLAILHDADTLDSRGLIGLKQERWRDAWADYDAAVRLGEGNDSLASFLYGRGLAALRLGREAEGRADMARAVALNATIAETYARNGVRP